MKDYQLFNIRNCWFCDTVPVKMVEINEQLDIP